MSSKTEHCESFNSRTAPRRDAFIRAMFLHLRAGLELVREMSGDATAPAFMEWERQFGALISEADGSPDETNILWHEGIVDALVNGKTR